MPVSIHKVPVQAGDDDIPNSSDSRLKPWLDSLIALGVMAPDGTAAKACHLKRGRDAENWIWRIEWDE